MRSYVAIGVQILPGGLVRRSGALDPPGRTIACRMRRLPLLLEETLVNSGSGGEWAIAN